MSATLAAIYDEGLEVPFLWLYRRAAVAPLPGQTLAHVWGVLDLDDAWLRTMAARAAVAATIDEAVAAGRCSSDTASRVSELLAGAHSERAAADVAAYAALLLECGGGVEGEDAGGVGSGAIVVAGGAAGGARAAVSNDVVRLAAASPDVRAIVRALYVTPDCLASNMRASSQIYAPPDLGGGADTEDALQVRAGRMRGRERGNGGDASGMRLQGSGGTTSACFTTLQAIAFEALSERFTTHEEVLHAAQQLAAAGIAAGACSSEGRGKPLPAPGQLSTRVGGAPKAALARDSTRALLPPQSPSSARPCGATSSSAPSSPPPQHPAAASRLTGATPSSASTRSAARASKTSAGRWCVGAAQQRGMPRISHPLPSPPPQPHAPSGPGGVCGSVAGLVDDEHPSLRAQTLGTSLNADSAFGLFFVRVCDGEG